MIFLVFLPIFAAIGWVLIHISKPAREQFSDFGTSTGNEGESLGDFRDYFSAPVKKGPWTQQAPRPFK